MADDKMIFVGNMDEAVQQWLRGEQVQPIEGAVEHTPGIPLTWYLPKSVDEKIRAYKQVMDANFPNLEGCEIGLMPVLCGDKSTTVQDVVLFHQEVTPSFVHHSPESDAEVYNRVEEMGPEFYPGGIIHFHPGNGTSPSITDFIDFRELTSENLKYHDTYGWFDATPEFSMAVSEQTIEDALREKDAAVLLPGENRTVADFKAYIKIKYGHSMFLIYSTSGERPWLGVGEAKKYCFEKGNSAYRLLDGGDGIELIITQDEIPVEINRDLIGAELEQYVKPLVPPKASRGIVSTEAAETPVLQMNPALVEIIEQQAPATAQEFFLLLGEFLRYAEDSPFKATVQAIHNAFAGIYSTKEPYEVQLEKARAFLGEHSPEYQQTIRKINGEEGW